MLSIIGVGTVLLMLVIAFVVNRSLPPSQTIPMQWGLRGQTNWSAPRKVGLLFFPMLGAVFMAFYIVLMKTSGPRAGQEGLVVPVMVFCALVLVAIQFAHFLLARRNLRNNGPR